ncbi:thiol-disulfide oxidoreductase DCC family protein [Marinagarivorans algicola]|uniref:thiol-disulfide oxidoreductase DCC family protein n=1 Tax=Marinagarivorans algicola TaxID=1513270 RepID=UPI0006B56F03|nr:DUF393 domain-containing protein [Marinagarivorans algicola]
MNQQPSGTVYYDGQCPLCNKEITQLKTKTCSLQFIDAHTHTELPKPRHLLLQQLHVITRTGQTLIGLDANIYMWRNSGAARLAAFFSLPVIYPIATRIYTRWAKYRYQKLYGKMNDYQ